MHYQHMSENPQYTESAADSSIRYVRDESGRFAPGTAGHNAPRKGRLGGRALALRLLDEILAEDEVQEHMADALRAAVMKDPLKFFKQIVMPLIPTEVKMKIAEEGPISWVRLATQFPTESN